MPQELFVKYVFFGLLLAAVSLEVTADIVFKKWVLESRNVFLFIGLAAYFVGTVFWAFSLKYEFLSKAVSLFTIMNLIAVVLVGVLVFNESLTPVNKAGIALGVVSIALIEF